MPIEFRCDGPCDLPDGWVWVRLGDIVDRLTDGTHQPPKFTPSGVPFVVIGNVSRDGIDWSSIRKWVSRSTYELHRLRPLQDDILYTAVGSYGLALRVVDDRDFMFQRHIAFLRPNKTIVDPTYLCHALNSPTLRRQADRAARGVAQKTVTLGSLREFEVPLAPLAEQRRIVARIDELFTDIADGETALTRASDDLDTWRRALLKAGVTGELTREWREHNKPNETGKDVLARVVAAKHSFKPSKSSGRRFVQDEAFDDRLIDLPNGWEWSSLGAIGEIVGGVTVDKERRPNDPVTVPYLRVANVQRGYLDLSKIKSITVERKVAKALALKKGDILLNEGGDRDKIGRGWVWDGEIEGCIHQNHVFRVRPYDPAINPYFVSHFANEMGRRFFVEKGKQTTNLASISMSKISQLPIPIVPAAELQEAMRILNEGLLATVDVEAELTAASISTAARQSILKTAFEGRLVEQDPHEEPAEHLLIRRNGSAQLPAPRRMRRVRGSVGAVV